MGRGKIKSKWMKYFDEESQHFYLYNEITQESRWCDEDGVELSAPASAVDDKQFIGYDINNEQTSHTLISTPSSTSNGTQISNTNSSSSAAKSKDTSSLTSKTKNKYAKFNKLLGEKVKGMFGAGSSSSSSLGRAAGAGAGSGETEAGPGRASAMVLCFASFHMLVFESSFAIAECVVRACCFIAAASAVLLYYVSWHCFPRLLGKADGVIVTLKWSRLCLREAALCGGAALSLIIPGMLCLYVYPEFYRPPSTIVAATVTTAATTELPPSIPAPMPDSARSTDDNTSLNSPDVKVTNDLGSWMLRPLPTILGPVDLRRLFSISYYGYGVLADNSLINDTFRSSDDVYSNHDGWRGPMLFIPADMVDFVYDLLGDSSFDLINSLDESEEFELGMDDGIGEDEQQPLWPASSDQQLKMNKKSKMKSKGKRKDDGSEIVA